MTTRAIALAAALVLGISADRASAQQPAGRDAATRSAITGEVIHAETGLPIAGATVVLVIGGALGQDGADRSAFLASSRSTITDALGRYRFDGLAAGPYALRVHRLGFRPVTIDVTMRGLDSRVSVGLSVVPIKLHPMVVATDNPEPYARRALTAAEQGKARRAAIDQRQRTVLSTDARELTHADVSEAVTLGETDLFRALQRLPGVSTRDEFTAELWVRGGRWDETRVLFDGLPLFNPVSGLGLLSSINADVIGGAMLYPGVKPASLAEGGSGLLDLETRPAGGTGALRGVGELSVASARLTLDQRIAGGRGGWLISGRRSYLDALLPIFAPDGPDSRFPYHFHDLTARFDWQLGAASAIEVSALQSTDRITGDVNDFIEGNRAHWGNTAARVTLRTPLGPLTARHTIGASAYDARMSVAPNESAADGEVDVPELPVISRIRHISLRGDVAPASATGAQWSAGYDLVTERAESDGEVHAVYTGDALALGRARDVTTLDRLALWGERRFLPAASVAIDVGSRLELGSRVGNGGVARLAPRVVARYAPNDATRISAGVGRSIQYSQAIAPSGGVSENIAYPIPLWTLAASDVPALRSDVATAGVERWLGATWQASANAFVRRSTGVLLPDPTPGPVTTHELFVAGRESARGLELGVRRVEGRATIAAGYSLGVARVDALGLRYPSAQDRRQSFDLTAMARPSRGFRIGLAYWAASGAPFTRRRGGSYGVDGERKFWVEPPTVAAPNARRYPALSSLDLLLDWSGTIRKVRAGVFVQLYNALGHDNPGAYAGESFCSRFDQLDNGCVPTDRFDSGLPRLPVAGIRIAF